jgi:hypothetical protein
MEATAKLRAAAIGNRLAQSNAAEPGLTTINTPASPIRTVIQRRGEMGSRNTRPARVTISTGATKFVADATATGSKLNPIA